MAAAAAAADGRGRRYEVLIVAAAATAAAAAAGTPSSAAGRTPSVRWFRENAPKPSPPPSPPSPSPRTTFSATERAARGPQWVGRVVARVCGDPLTDHVSTSASHAVALAWVPLPPPRRAGLMSLQRARARRAFQISSQHRLRSRSTSPALPVSPLPAPPSPQDAVVGWFGWGG